MNIQIFRTKKSSDTRKSERFFKERGIKFQSVVLKENDISADELADKVFENQPVIRQTIVRNGKQATVGYVPDVWKGWQ